MQIKPSTAGRSAAELEFPPVNIEAGTAHLAELSRQLSSPDEVIAAYNSSPWRVKAAKAHAAQTGSDWRDYLPKGTTETGELYDTKQYLEDVKERLAKERHDPAVIPPPTAARPVPPPAAMIEQRAAEVVPPAAAARPVPPPAAAAEQRAAEVVPPPTAARPVPPAAMDTQVRDALANIERHKAIIQRDLWPSYEQLLKRLEREQGVTADSPNTKGRTLPPEAGTEPTPPSEPGVKAEEIQRAKNRAAMRGGNWWEYLPHEGKVKAPPPAVGTEPMPEQLKHGRMLLPEASLETRPLAAPAVQPEIKRRLQEEQKAKDELSQLSPQQQERAWGINAVSIDVPPTVFTLRKENGEIVDVIRVQPTVRAHHNHMSPTSSPTAVIG